MKKGDLIHGINQAGKSVCGEVMWVVGNEFSIKNPEGGYSVLDKRDLTNLTITLSAAPSYQSSVADLTDDQLRESIDALRASRANVQRPRRKATAKGTGCQRVKTKVDPMEAAIAKLTPEKREDLQRKLGLID